MRMPKPSLDWVHAALDGDLSPEQQVQFEQYLAETPEAQAMWSALSEVDQLLGAASMVKPRPGFSKRFETRLASQRSRAKTFWGTLALGAGAMVSVGALSVLVISSAIVAGATGFAQQPLGALSMQVTRAAVTFADVRAVINALATTVYALGEWGLMQPVAWSMTVFGLAATALWLYLIRKLNVEVTIS